MGVTAIASLEAAFAIFSLLCQVCYDAPFRGLCFISFCLSTGLSVNDLGSFYQAVLEIGCGEGRRNGFSSQLFPSPLLLLLLLSGLLRWNPDGAAGR